MTQPKTTITITCPVCGDDLEVVLAYQRVLLVDVDTNEPQTASFAVELDAEASTSLHGHGCLEVTDEDRSQLAAYLESAMSESSDG